MNEASSPKDLKSSNSPPGGGASNYDEFKKNLGIFPEDREDEKVPDTEEKKSKREYSSWSFCKYVYKKSENFSKRKPQSA